MADIKKIKLPGVATAFDIVDQGARDLISQLESKTEYLGVTTTELTDGASTNPITIGGVPVTAVAGNIANYGSKEFIFNGTIWQEFGDLSELGDLAFVDTAETTYTPVGTVSTPTISLGGTAEAAAQSITVGGSATAAAQTVTIGGTASAAAQSVSIGGTATAAAQSIELTSSSVSIPNVTAVGSMPTYAVDANGVLTITDGAVPTLGTAISVHDVTGATASSSSVDLTSVTATASASSVDLTSVTATAQASDVSLTNVTATAQASSVDFTSMTATSSQPTFTGTEATIVVEPTV